MRVKLLYSIIFTFSILNIGFTRSVWEWDSWKPAPPESKIEGFAYGDNQFIAAVDNGTIPYSKEEDNTPVLSNFGGKSTHLPSITNVSNRLFIKINNTRHVGKNLRVSLFNASGRTIYVYTTKMKETDRIFSLPIQGLSQLSGGVYHAKITGGKSFEYYGSFAITR